MNHSALNAYLRDQPFPLALLRSPESGFYPKKIKPLSLDIGCGDGFFAKYTFGDNGIDIGVEVDAKTSARAGASLAYRKIITFNGVKLPFPSGAFSTVISNSVLEHVDNPIGLIKEIGRVTKTGGLFYLTVPTTNFRKCLLGVRIFNKFGFAQAAKAYGNFMDVVTRQKYYWPVLQWNRILKTAGFDIVSHSAYFGKKSMAWFDLTHWLSIPSILTKFIFHRWVLFNSSTVKLKLQKLLVKQILKIDPPPHAFQFFVCRKTSA
jgi:SAM-dependent methyltransferase